MSPKDSNRARSEVSLPWARGNEIVIQELENEMLVYDLREDKAHHLNETVSAVWKYCDGETQTEEMVRRLQKRFDAKIGEDFVWLALDELEKADLIDAGKAKDDFTLLSRRKVLFRYAPMAVALPIVMSLVAPPAAHAQSCAPVRRMLSVVRLAATLNLVRV